VTLDERRARRCARLLNGVVANVLEAPVSTAMALFRRLTPLSPSTAIRYNAVQLSSIHEPLRGFVKQNVPFSLLSSCFNPLFLSPWALSCQSYLRYFCFASATLLRLQMLLDSAL
jgi:hypothetical protein